MSNKYIAADIPINRGFESNLQSFYAGCQAITEADRAKHYAATTPDVWRLEKLQKRVRIVRGDSVHCFVDFATGDVLKAASWKVPAKHARGNIFDESNGLKFMGPFGPAYLR